MRLGYLGPCGTFSEKAALEYLRGQGKTLPYPSLPQLVAAAEERQITAALLPLENSLEGSVAPTLSALIKTSLLICAEIIVPITHYLAVRPGTEKPKLVLSHPHALAQCNEFLTQLGAKIGETASTAAAAQLVSQTDEELGAICSLEAAQLYNLVPTKIETWENLATRFIVLAKEDAQPTGEDKTSLLLSAKADQPGWLYQVLQEFAENKINLTRIESRPTGQALGHYHFFIDFEGHHNEPQIKKSLDKIRSSVSCFRLLGSYPKAKTCIP